MKVDVIAKRESGEETCLATDVAERVAVKLAAEQAGKRDDWQVYIRWYRQSDGQVGYRNRDGHSPVGRAW